MEKEKQYIYIVQALLEPSKCKIGKTNDLQRRLKEYNNMTGKSKENTYQVKLFFNSTNRNIPCERFCINS